MTRLFLIVAVSVAVIGCTGCNSTTPDDSVDVEALFSDGKVLTDSVISQRNSYCLDNPDYLGCTAWCSSPEADCGDGPETAELKADFQHMRISERTVSFTNMSANAEYYLWDFGDSVNSSDEHPTHTFAAFGEYAVSLTATGGGQTDTHTKQVIVAQSQPNPPSASFSYSAVDLAVSFTSTSQDATTSAWDFGDGNSSSDTNPTHTYASFGSYVVSLTVSNVDGSDVATDTLTVAGANPPSASFMYSTVELTATFSNTSQNAISSTWDLGDGSSSTEVNPGHTYPGAGTYWVVLTVTNEDGSDTATDSVTVSSSDPTPVPPVAGFSFTTDKLVVSFSNSSSNADASSWDFGDGGASTEASPSHTYTNAGTYSVTLTVTNEDGSDNDTQNVTVRTPVPPVAGFSFTTDKLVVSFSNSSSNADASSWDFGDGGASTEASPSHTYTNAGTYSVTLTVTNEDGSDNDTQNVTVNDDVPPPPNDGSIWMAGHSYMRGIETMIDLGADLGEYRGGEGFLATWLERSDLAVLPARDYEHAGFIEWLQRQDQVAGSAAAASDIEALVGYDISIMVQWFQTEPACNTHGLACGPAGQAHFNDLYNQMAALAGVELIPVGDAFVNAYNAGVTSLHSDGSHTTVQGEYLRNVTLYSYFSGIDARTMPGLGVANADILKQSAYDALNP